MTERTTPITVHLTDEQMDQHTPVSYGHQGSANHALWHAIKAQRPRPITVGDRVKWNEVTDCEVRAIHEGRAWLWQGPTCFGTYMLSDLTRVVQS